MVTAGDISSVPEQASKAEHAHRLQWMHSMLTQGHMLKVQWELQQLPSKEMPTVYVKGADDLSRPLFSERDACVLQESSAASRKTQARQSICSEPAVILHTFMKKAAHTHVDCPDSLQLLLSTPSKAIYLVSTAAFKNRQARQSTCLQWTLTGPRACPKTQTLKIHRLCW